MYYECPECGYQLHNAEQPFGWECLGGIDGKPRHHATKMLERYKDPPRPPKTPAEHDLKAVLDIMDKHGWTTIQRGNREVTASAPFTYLRLK